MCSEEVGTHKSMGKGGDEKDPLAGGRKVVLVLNVG